MNTIIAIISIVAGLLGIGVAIHNLYTTRNKYYKDYLKRKRNEKA